jgi:AcrR family transcriptional regulator
MNDMSQSASTPATRRSRTRSADVERELLAAAEEVLVRDGPGGLTVRAVAAQAGIAPMGVYNRLGGKDGLVDALLIRGFDRLTAAIEGSSPGPGTSMHDRFLACGRHYRAFALANQHFYAIMFEDAIPRDREADNPLVEEHAYASFNALVRLVELGAAAGAISAPEPTEVAQQIWSGVHGAVALELKGLVLTPDPPATYDAFLETILRGLAPHEDHPHEDQQPDTRHP